MDEKRQSFADRGGFVPPAESPHVSDMDGNLRIAIWNCVLTTVFIDWDHSYNIIAQRRDRSDAGALFKRIWTHHLRKAHDDAPEESRKGRDEIKSHILSAPWCDVYDLVEFISNDEVCPSQFEEQINITLERANSAYRLVNGVVANTVSPVEVAELERVIASDSSTRSGEHIIKALRLFAQRPEPDYCNSIKESISAVECVMCEVAAKPNATLADVAPILRERRIGHGALIAGFEKLYAFTCDASGVRHKHKGFEHEDARPDASLARYFLVACSAFVNYLNAPRSDRASDR